VQVEVEDVLSGRIPGVLAQADAAGVDRDAKCIGDSLRGSRDRGELPRLDRPDTDHVSPRDDQRVSQKAGGSQRNATTSSEE
jgi:hypothetical protein